MKIFKALLGLFCSGVLATGFLLVEDKFVWNLNNDIVFWIAFLPNLLILRSIVDFVSEHIDRIFDLNVSSDNHLVFKELEEKIAKVNEGWTPDFNNNEEEKWYPFFKLNNGKITLDSVDYGFNCCISKVPPSLTFKSKETCRKFVEENIKLYEKLYK